MHAIQLHTSPIYKILTPKSLQMKSEIFRYNRLWLKHHAYQKKLDRLILLGEKSHRQKVLKKHLAKLKRQLLHLWRLLQKHKAARLAVGVFLLGMATAQAQIPTYKIHEVNPFGLSKSGYLNISVSFGDLDGDGDFDVFSGTDANYGTGSKVYYYENIGNATNPNFEQHLNPFGLTNGGELDYSRVALVDLDGDLDLDLVAVNHYNDSFHYFENVGDVENPTFGPKINNPFNLPLTNGIRNATLTFADLDGDGDLDLLSGDSTGNFFYLKNEGDDTSPSFAGKVQNAYSLIKINSLGHYPSFCDFDSDGDFDILDKMYGATNFYYIKNTGNFSTPNFDTPMNITDYGFLSDYNEGTVLDFADMDGDGDLDMLMGSQDSNFQYFQYVDQDLDNDGILDSDEVTFYENGGVVTYSIWGDEDGDGIPNYRDTTDDDLNNLNGDGSITNYADANNDRIPDIFDTDLDGRPNYIDLDSDNDGIPDVIEAQSTTAFKAPDKIYGADDGVDTNYTGGLTPVDTDSDHIPDFLDTDSDGDSLDDKDETGLLLNGVTEENGLDTAYNFVGYDDPTAEKNLDENNIFTEYQNNGSQYAFRNSPQLEVLHILLNTVSLSQNPVTTHFEIVGLTEPGTIRVHTLVGILVKELSNYQTGVIDISDLTAGIYFIELSVGTNTKVLSLIKQ